MPRSVSQLIREGQQAMKEGVLNWIEIATKILEQQQDTQRNLLEALRTVDKKLNEIALRLDAIEKKR